MIRVASLLLLTVFETPVSARSRPLPSLSPAQLRPLRNRLRQSVRDAGLTDLPPSEHQANPTFWELDPNPLIISPDEWNLLENAIRQRARITNAFLHDLYSKQTVMHEGIIPPELVFSDPYFRRACHNLQPDRLDPAALIRFDLVKTSDGWFFTETHTNTPVGLSYAVQNRRFLTQEAGDYYRSLPDYHSIINAPLELVNTLRHLSPHPGGSPSMVFLTTGPRYPFYSEHSFLARKMGLRLAQGDDLLVSDNRVYFKTTAGLEQVDVIYRRVNDTHIDPAVFSTDIETAGIPGLIQCIRAGNVTVANAIGSGVAENRALHAYLPALSKYLLGERLLMPSVPTLLCTDNDQIDQIIENADRLELWPTHSSRLGTPQPDAPSFHRDQLPKIVRENPAEFVARSILKPNSLTSTRRRQSEFRLSAFALTRQDRVSVIPGGILNVGPEPHPRDRVGRCADVIVLAGDRASSGSLSDFETENDTGTASTIPGSRSAETLFWLGRYLERAEATARMLSILDDVSLEEISSQDRKRWLPLWRGLLVATGHADQKIDARTNPQSTLTGDLIWRMTLGRKHPSSLLNTVGAAASNARGLRDFLSPEAGNILTAIDLKLREAARQSPQTRNKLAREKRTQIATRALKAVQTEINACLGSSARTMLQDAGWHFLEIGKQIERATLTANKLQHVLTGAAALADQADDSTPLVFRDNPELSSLLRMLGSQDAYRRLYRRRSQPLFVAQMLLQQPHAPRSILHNLHQIRQSLAAIDQQSRARSISEVRVAVDEQIEALTNLSLDQFFDGNSAVDECDANLADVLAKVVDNFAELHQGMDDHYFSHQARFDTPDGQTELRI